MSNGLIFNDFAIKETGMDEDDAMVSFKVTVTNNSDDEYIHITLQGIDEDHFEIYTVLLTGNIAIGSSKTLTTGDYIDIEKYVQISDWIIE